MLEKKKAADDKCLKIKLKKAKENPDHRLMIISTENIPMIHGAPDKNAPSRPQKIYLGLLEMKLLFLLNQVLSVRRLPLMRTLLSLPRSMVLINKLKRKCHHWSKRLLKKKCQSRLGK